MGAGVLRYLLDTAPGCQEAGHAIRHTAAVGLLAGEGVDAVVLVVEHGEIPGEEKGA